MADVQPLRALHYDLIEGRRPAAGRRPALRRDRRGPARGSSWRRSPYNVVEIDLPAERRRSLRARRRASWRAGATRGSSSATTSPRCGRSRRTTPARTGSARTRHGVFARVRVEDYGPGRIRPHERTHPGPKEDRLRLTRATRANLSPIFSLYDDPAGAAWGARRAVHVDGDAVGRGHRRRRHGPPALARRRRRRDRRVQRRARRHRAADRRRPPPLRDRARLPRRRRPSADHVLMCLVALQDPGLTVFPTHRLLIGARRRPARRRCAQRSTRLGRERRRGRARAASDDRCSIGYYDAHGERPLTLYAARTRRSPTPRCRASPSPTAGSTPRCSRR